MKKETDIFSLLKKDHQAVKKLFTEIEKTTDRAAKKREKLYAKVKEELTRHSHGEEVAIYPRLKAHSKTEDIGWESIEEHAVVKYLLARIDEVSPNTPDWTALMSVLKEAVEHHVEEEESKMFSKMRQTFSKEEREEIAAQFVTAKEETDLLVDGAPILPHVPTRAPARINVAA